MSQLLHLGEAIGRNARLFPNKVGAKDLTRSMTQWDERSCRLANALLGSGLAAGDRVAILAYNCLEWLEIYAAIAKAGLVAVPINFRLGRLRGRVHRPALRRTGVHCPAHLRMYTSGTTGRPKRAIRSHGSHAVLALTTALDMDFSSDDAALLVMPMFHANSLAFTSTFAYLGATCVVDDSPSFDP